MLTSKLQKVIYLLLGSVCLVLSKCDWPMVLPGFLFSYFPLRYTRSKIGIAGIFWLYVTLSIFAFLGSRNQMAFFPLEFAIISTAVNSLILILPLLLDRFFYRRIQGFVQCLIYPSLITSWEFIRCILPNAFGTWSALAFSQIENPLLMQTTSLFGIFAVTFLVAFIGSFLNWLQDQHWDWTAIRKPVIATLSIISGLLLYGNIQLKQEIPIMTTRLAGIVSKADNSAVDITRRDYNYWRSVLSPPELNEKALARTKQAIDYGAKIVVWAEAYLVIDEAQQEILFKKLGEIASENQVYILASYLLLKDPSQPGHLMQNKAVMINSQGKVAFQYLKSFLTPGVEDSLIDPGSKRIPALDTEYGRIATVICYDLVFPQYIRQIITRKVDLLLVPGHDAKGFTPIATQMASIEALQDRTALIRVTTDGLSAGYDNLGHCLGQMNAFNTREDIFICDIPIQRGYSFYGAYGWIFPYLVLILTGLLFGWYLIFRMPAEIIQKKAERKNNMIH